MNISIEPFFDKATSTLTYVVFDSASRDALLIDPVWDYEPSASTLSDAGIKKVIEYIEKNNLNLHLILETHSHADHMTSAQVVKKHFPQAKLGISWRIKEVQEIFCKLYEFSYEEIRKKAIFDFYVKEGETLQAGTLMIQVLETPGHTPACTSYLIGDVVFTGDLVFMPDSGTGRSDFPGGSAQKLYHSIKRIYSLPEHTEVYVGHDYQPGGRDVKFKATVLEQRKHNIHIKDSTLEADFVQLRETRDQTLSPPRLLLPSLQVNILGGAFLESSEEKKAFLKIPVYLER